MITANTILVANPEGNKSLWRPILKWEGNINPKIYTKGIGFQDMRSIRLVPVDTTVAFEFNIGLRTSCSAERSRRTPLHRRRAVQFGVCNMISFVEIDLYVEQ
jgi:hypothetical protein